MCSLSVCRVREFSEGLYAASVQAKVIQEAAKTAPSRLLPVLGRCQTKFTFTRLGTQEHCNSLAWRSLCVRNLTALFLTVG